MDGIGDKDGMVAVPSGLNRGANGGGVFSDDCAARPAGTAESSQALARRGAVISWQRAAETINVATSGSVDRAGAPCSDEAGSLDRDTASAMTSADGPAEFLVQRRAATSTIVVVANAAFFQRVDHDLRKGMVVVSGATSRMSSIAIECVSISQPGY